MKKLALTMALVLVMGLGAIAQEGDGLLRKGGGLRETRDLTTPSIPSGWGIAEDVDGETGTPAPLGSGIAVLLGLGAAYVVAKKRKED